MTIIKGNNPVSEDVLKAIEQYLSFNFPKGYREFFLKYNGGETEKNIFLFKEDHLDGSILDRLFGILPDNYVNLLVYMRNYKERIPSNCMPIGADPGGNLILISVKGPDRGKIYFWDHEMEADPAQGEVPDYSNLTLIADSFDEFINNLRNDEEVVDNDES